MADKFITKEQLLEFAHQLDQAMAKRWKFGKIRTLAGGAGLDIEEVNTIIDEFIRTHNEVPAVAEIDTAMGLMPNIAGGVIQSMDQLNDAIADWIAEHPQAGLTTNDVLSIIAQYIIDNNVVPTVAEIDTALDLEVHNEQTALNFTVDQVKNIIEDYVTENPITGITTEDVQTTLVEYIQNNNIVPTVAEIDTALDLEVHNEQTALNFTVDQVKDIVADYLTDNPVPTLTDTDVNALISTYIENNNIVPTVTEIEDALDLNTAVVLPQPVLNIKTPMIKTFDDINEAIINKITAINMDLPVPPAQNIRYIYNRTQPLYVQTWAPTDNLQINISATDMQYCSICETLFVATGSDIQRYDKLGNNIDTLSIAADNIAVTVDGHRICAHINNEIHIFDYINDQYTDVRTLDNLHTDINAVVCDMVGIYIVAYAVGSDIVQLYKLNSSIGTYELIHTLQHNVSIKDVCISVDALKLYILGSDDTVTPYTLNGTTYEIESDIIFVTVDVNDAETVYTPTLNKLLVSTDLRRILATNGTDEAYMFYLRDNGRYALETTFTQVDMNFNGNIAINYDLYYLWFADTTNNKIIQYQAYDYTQN
jgi:hypothetical protein